MINACLVIHKIIINFQTDGDWSIFHKFKSQQWLITSTIETANIIIFGSIFSGTVGLNRCASGSVSSKVWIAAFNYITKVFGIFPSNEIRKTYEKLANISNLTLNSHKLVVASNQSNQSDDFQMKRNPTKSSQIIILTQGAHRQSYDVVTGGNVLSASFCQTH